MGSTVADVIAGAFLRHGITFVLGQSNPTALMLAAERLGIRQVLYRTENAAGVMADGFSRVSGQITVVAAQNGPAATLFVPPMAEALKASIPMLVVVQEVPASVRDRNAFQEFDHVALFAAVSKWTRRVDDPSRVEDNVDLAITVANSGRPGPVVLLLPKDVLELEVDQPNRFRRTRNLGTFPLDRPRPESAAVARAAELLAGAEAPVVIAGGGVHISGAVRELATLVERTQLPIATTHMGKGTVDDTHPLSLGVAANLTGEHGPVHFNLPLLRQADVVLLVGTRTNENGTDSWTLTSPDATYIHVDVDGLEIGRNYESVRLVGDARSALADLTAALDQVDLTRRAQAAAGLRDRVAEGRRRHAEAVAPLVASDRQPIAPQRVMAELDKLLQADDIVTADASYSSIWVTGFLTARAAGQRFLSPRGLAGLGWGLPLAMGAKLARPDARTIAVVGDGGFAHVWSELETAVRERIPVVVIVLNNAELAYQRHAENYGHGRATTAIAFAPVDHAALARAAGARGIVVRDPAELEAVLTAALAAELPTVLDVITDPNAFAPVGWMTSALAQADTGPARSKGER